MAVIDVVAGEVRVYDDTGVLLWAGRPIGHPVTAALSILGTNDSIVLCHSPAPDGRSVRNLVRVSANGTVLWQAELPDRGNDSYVTMEWAGAPLVANSWSGFRVEIDLVTGRVVRKVFTK